MSWTPLKLDLSMSVKLILKDDDNLSILPVTAQILHGVVGSQPAFTLTWPSPWSKQQNALYWWPHVSFVNSRITDWLRRGAERWESKLF